MSERHFNELTMGEGIELVAAVCLRVAGFSYAARAFFYLFHLKSYWDFHQNGFQTFFSNSTVQSYLTDILYEVTLAAITFLLTVPLARLLTRGLLPLLQPLPKE